MSRLARLQIDWKDRTMSFTGLSAWLASLFPDKMYPVPLKGFDQTIRHLFDSGRESFPKVAMKYLSKCQPFMSETERVLREYPLEELHLPKWNTFYRENPGLGLSLKNELSKVDWVWLVQDYHLFVHREELGLYGKKKGEIGLAEEFEPIAVEGGSKLATHMRSERNSSLIRRIKEGALNSNQMLNCEVCGFSFRETYGELGEGFIEAHHIEPLSQRNESRPTTKDEIALVCSNCHRMLHKEVNGKLLSIEELKSRISV